MNITTFTFSNKLWEYEGKGAWFFVTVPQDISTEIHTNMGSIAKGWGTIPVEVTIGTSVWRTSLFWSKDGYYYLPIKAAIRKKEKLNDGDNVEVTIGIDWII